jgi:DNA-directed RNA polymerase II subunit RPB1
MESSQGRSEDDLTVKLMDIVRTNRSLREHERNGAPNHIQLQHVALLQVIQGGGMGILGEG